MFLCLEEVTISYNSGISNKNDDSIVLLLPANASRFKMSLPLGFHRPFAGSLTTLRDTFSVPGVHRSHGEGLLSTCRKQSDDGRKVSLTDAGRADVQVK